MRLEVRLDLKIALEQALEAKRSTLTLRSIVSFDGVPRRVSMHISPSHDVRQRQTMELPVAASD